MIHSLIALAILTAPNVSKDVVYSKAGGESLQMDIYRPANATSKALPAVIVIHGGAWMGGKRQEMAALCEAIANEGMVAATTSYRLAPKYKWPAMLDDVQTAVRYLRANAKELGIDPKRIGASGASAGGHLSLLLGFRDNRVSTPTEYAGQSSKVKAVFNIFGPTDMRRDFPANLDPVFAMVLGKKRSEATEELKDASPVHWVTSDDAPVFTIQGDKDPLVPYVQAQWLKENLDRAKVPNVLHIVPGMAHGINPGDQAQAQVLKSALDWMKQQLSN